MSNFEGYQDNKTFLNNFTVPTLAMRSGDFSALATPLLDPATCTATGSSRTCRPFAGNRIPTNRIADLATAARVLSGAERAGTGQQLRLAHRSRDRPEAYPAHGLRPELVAELDGALQLEP